MNELYLKIKRLISGYITSWCLIATLFLVACETNEPQVFEGPYHVRFTKNSDEIVENYHDPIDNANHPASVSIHIASPLLESETRIQYRLGGSATEGEDYEIIGENMNEAVIPAGESFTDIQFRVLNNRERQDNRLIKMTITSVNNDLKIGRGGGNLGRTFEYTITDDDCLVDLRNFQGTWQFEETAQGGEGQSHSYEVEMRPNFEYNNRVEIEGFAGLDSMGAKVFMNMDLCAQEVMIPEQTVQGVNGSLGNVRTVNKGTFNANDGTISFTYTLDDFGATQWSVTGTRQ